MLPIHAALTFLTMDQALRALSKVSKEPATREDLLSLCVDGQCKLYVEMDCSGLMKPDTLLGENTRQIEVSDDQTTPYLFR